MNRTVYSVEGKELHSIDLANDVFGLPPNEDVIWYAINNELASARLGTACTKDRSEVRGSNRKPYRQKGTGRARRGQRRTPLAVGGGVTFGPKPRDFSYSINKKTKRLAMKTILSLKLQDDRLKIIEDFQLENGKTQELAKILKNFGADERTVFIISEPADLIRRAGRNIPWLTMLAFNRLRAHDLFYGRRVLVLESAAKNLNDFYGEAAEAAE